MAQGGAITLRELVRERLFTVPDYQRPYAWGEKQLRDLREDIDLMGSQGRHYTGTIVLARRPSLPSHVDPDSLTEWEVVDGQQRLTTLFLLVSRIIRRLRALSNPQAQEVADALDADFGPVTVAHAARPRLHLAGDLKDYWRWAILEERGTALLAETTGHTLLRDAATYFDAWLDDLAQEDEQSTLHVLADLATRTADGLELLVYETDSSADVGVLFESLNDRGRNLTELELIKNYLLYLARLLDEPTRSDLATFINGSWSRMHKNFAAAPALTEDSVLRAHWAITQNSDQFDGARSIKAAYPRGAYVAEQTRLGGTTGAAVADPLARLHDHITEYVTTLEQCTLFARELHDRDSRFVGFTSVSRAHALAVNERLRHTSYGMVRFFPLLFAARMTHPHDGDLYTDLLELCETYVVRIFLLTRWRTHTGRSSLRRLGRRIVSEQLSPEGVRGAMVGLIRYYADDDRVRSSLEQPTNWYELAGHKFLLYEYERHLLRDGASMKPWESFVDNRYRETTEHVLPQTPRTGSRWRDLFPDKKEREQLTHSLGNLVLTLDNSRYSNKEWEDKRGTSDAPSDAACYYNGSLAQERQIARDFAVWDPDAVRRRQAILNAWIIDRWALPAAELAGIDEAELDADTVTDEVVAARLAEEEDQ